MANGLSHQRQRLVEELADPGCRSIMAAGRKVYSTPKTAYQALQDPRVQTALERAKRAKRAASASTFDRLVKLQSKLLTRLELIVQDDEKDLSLQDAGSLTQLISNLQANEVKIRALLPPELPKTAEEWDKSHARAARIARAAQRLDGSWPRVSLLARRIVALSRHGRAAEYSVEFTNPAKLPPRRCDTGKS